jgi:RNA polymerase sigma-70 factor (ECF subfamily)
LADADDMTGPGQRRRLVGIAYRLTGSRADAEDIVQESLARWLGRERGDIRSPEAFLTRTVVNLSLNRLRDRRARDYPGEWLPEPVASDGLHEIERLEDISYAFLALLERLTPLQRAVFVLRSAFDCSYSEIAGIVGAEEAACRKTFSRANAAVSVAKQRRPISRAEHRRALEGFMPAAAGGDIRTLAAMLAPDVEMHGDGGPFGPALKKPLFGSDVAARFAIASRALLPDGTEVAVNDLNGVAAGVFRAGGKIVLAILIEADGGKITRIFALANPEKLGSAGRA